MKIITACDSFTDISVKSPERICVVSQRNSLLQVLKFIHHLTFLQNGSNKERWLKIFKVVLKERESTLGDRELYVAEGSI